MKDRYRNGNGSMTRLIYSLSSLEILILLTEEEKCEIASLCLAGQWEKSGNKVFGFSGTVFMVSAIHCFFVPTQDL